MFLCILLRLSLSNVMQLAAVKDPYIYLKFPIYGTHHLILFFLMRSTDDKAMGHFMLCFALYLNLWNNFNYVLELLLFFKSCITL